MLSKPAVRRAHVEWERREQGLQVTAVKFLVVQPQQLHFQDRISHTFFGFKFRTALK